MIADAWGKSNVSEGKINPKSIQEHLQHLNVQTNKKQSDVEKLISDIGISLSELESVVRGVEQSFSYVITPIVGKDDGISTSQVKEVAESSSSKLIHDLNIIKQKIEKHARILKSLSERSSVK